MDFERFDIADKVIGCAEGYRSKLKSLKELGPNEIDLDGPLAIVIYRHTNDFITVNY